MAKEDLKTKEEKEDADPIGEDVTVVIEGEEEPAPKAKPKKEEKEIEEPVEEERRAKDEKKDESGEETDEEREKIRERRREERKLRKERQELQARELEFLRRKTEDLESRLQQGERRIVNTDYQRLESGIADAMSKIEEAKSIHSKAVAEQNGAAASEAVDAMTHYKGRLEFLNNAKQRMIASAQEARDRPQVDQQVVTHARAWMSKNAWYDPKGGNEDSKIALAIDDALAQEGWNPRTPLYWEEFNKRVAKRLPHLIKPQKDDLDEEEEESSPTSGSGRERASVGGKQTYKLSKERVEAMKLAGAWEDPKERARYIKRYMDYDKEHAKDNKGG